MNLNTDVTNSQSMAIGSDLSNTKLLRPREDQDRCLQNQHQDHLK